VGKCTSVTLPSDHSQITVGEEQKVIPPWQL
jgi:hypothetical protein